MRDGEIAPAARVHHGFLPRRYRDEHADSAAFNEGPFDTVDCNE